MSWFNVEESPQVITHVKCTARKIVNAINTWMHVHVRTHLHSCPCLSYIALRINMLLLTRIMLILERAWSAIYNESTISTITQTEKLTTHTLSTWAKSPGMPKWTITGKQWLCSSIQACSWILMKHRKKHN